MTDLIRKTSLKDLSQFDQFMVQILSYYFPETPTYGPAFLPGEPRNTNGLEGKWNSTQEDVNSQSRNLFMGKLQKLMQVLKNQTTIDHVVTRPVENDWNQILGANKKDEFMKGGYEFMTFYSRSSKKLLRTKKEVTKSLQDCVLYMPTMYNYKLVLQQAIEFIQSIDNPGQYCIPIPKVSSSTKIHDDQLSKYGYIMKTIMRKQMTGK